MLRDIGGSAPGGLRRVFHLVGLFHEGDRVAQLVDLGHRAVIAGFLQLSHEPASPLQAHDDLLSLLFDFLLRLFGLFFGVGGFLAERLDFLEFLGQGCFLSQRKEGARLTEPFAPEQILATLVLSLILLARFIVRRNMYGQRHGQGNHCKPHESPKAHEIAPYALCDPE